MTRQIVFIILLVSTISCNLKKKKGSADYPQKTSLKKLNPNLKASVERGRILYDDLCVVCHMPNGKGSPNVFPPVAKSDYLKNNQAESIKGIKNGMKGEMLVNGIIYNSPMAPLGLTNEEVADVMNYINNSWGNNYGKFIATEDVIKALKN